MRLFSLLALSACSIRPAALEVPFLVIPDDLVLEPAELQVENAFFIPVENRGTQESLVRLTYTGPISGPDSVRVASGATVRLPVGITPVSIQSTEAEVTFHTDYQVVTGSIQIRVEPDLDGDGALSIAAGGFDCDDHNAAVFPGALEICNGLDDDCDGRVDASAVDARAWFTDHDLDGWGDASNPITACTAPPRRVSTQGDCDDNNPSIHPEAHEVYYDGIDQNCDGQSDYDADGDGYDSVGHDGLDCRDSDINTHPGATELPSDGQDQDCDGWIDERPPVLGELAITEVHPNPTEGPVFVELTSRTAAPLALDGLSAGAVTLHSDTATIPPFGTYVICDSASNYCDIVLEDLTLSSEDTLVIGQPLLDSVPLTDLPWQEGLSAQWPLTPDPVGNDNAASWCATLSDETAPTSTPGSVDASCDNTP